MFHHIYVKESNSQEHLLPTEEIPQIIVAMTVDSREEEGMLMREVDLQIERGTQVGTEDLPEEEDYPVMEDPLMMEDCLMEEDRLMMEDCLMMEDHLMEDDCLMEEDHLMMEDPLMMEDHLMEMEDPQDVQIEEDPQDLEDLPDQ